MKKYLSVLLIAFAATCASAQTPKELVAMLPAIDGWKLSDKVEVFNRDNLFDRINGAADAFLLCNFVEMTAVDYTKNGTNKYVTLQMYRHATPVDAFGIYSAERSSEPVFINIGAEGYRDTGLVYFLADSMYIKVLTSDESPETAAMMEKVAGRLAAKINPSAKLPAILKVFPAENKQPRSETYTAQGFLGHKFLHSAFRATYLKDGKEYSLFIIDGKTKEGAEKMFADYYKFAKQAGMPAEGYFIMPDRFNGDIPLLWKGRYIFGVFNDSDAKIDADAILKLLAANMQQ